MGTLEEYSLKSMHLAKMTGIMMGVHAIKDAFLLMHTGVGCKYKTAAQLSQHDWATHPNKKEGWTQVGDRAVIKGSSGRIAPFARSWAERRDPGFMAVVSAVFLELTGEDFSDAVRKTEADDFPCPMAFLGTGGAAGDFYQGYAAMQLAVAKKLNWKVAPEDRRQGEVGILGHMFTRYEADQRADLAQMKSLMRGLGLTMGPCIFSGSNYEGLTSIGGAEHLIQLPYAKPAAKKLKRATKRDLHSMHLPIGIAGTSRWVRELAAATGVPQGRAEAFIRKHESKTRDQVGKLKDRYAGVPVGIVAETPLAAGLTSMLTEFGFRPMFIGLRDDSLGQRELFDEWLEKDGVKLPEGAEVVNRPSLRLLREELLSRIERGQLMGFLGSSTDTQLLQGSSLLLNKRPFILQVGFPSTRYHVTYSIPTYGYGGVMAMGQRILDQILSVG